MSDGETTCANDVLPNLLEDVSNSEAFQILEQLTAESAISHEQSQLARDRYEALHKELIAAMSREKDLLDSAKGLKHTLDAERRRLEKPMPTQGLEASQTLDLLREDVDQAKAEANIALVELQLRKQQQQEREQLLQLEVTELQRQRQELMSQLDEISEEHRQALLPQIEQLQAETGQLHEEVDSESSRRAEVEAEVRCGKERLQGLVGQKKMLKEVTRVQQKELEKVQGLPEKSQRQTVVVESVLRSVKRQGDAMQTRIREADASQVAAAAKVQQLQDEHGRLMSAIARATDTIAGKEKEMEDLRREIDIHNIEYDRLLADQVGTEMELKVLQQSLRREQDNLNSKLKEREKALRRYRKAELTLKAMQDQLPPLRATLHNARQERSLNEQETECCRAEVEVVRNDVDAFMHSYLQEEAVGREKGFLFKLSFEEIQSLEEEVKQWRATEMERAREISLLSGLRDRAARVLAQKCTKLRRTRESISVNSLIIKDLTKQQAEVKHRVRDFRQLYDLVKNQRNKFVSLIQAARQNMGEMKEKLKIVGSEQQILKAESAMKDRLASKARIEHQGAMLDRDSLRSQLNKQALVFREKHNNVEEQLAEIEKLSAIINTAERQMLQMRKQYEVVVESRNYMGIKLIDHNDELCILYEKANIQEKVLQAGTLALKRRDDEVRLLKIDVQDVQRSIEVVRRTLPRIPKLDADVARLQEELLRTRHQAEELSLRLENPLGNNRWRELDNKVASTEDLAARVNKLEQRLNDKKELLLEKELILQEVTTLSNRLREQAAHGRPAALALAKKVNSFQDRIRVLTRRMMASLSELSMYQATSMKLQSEKEVLQDEVETAQARFAQGLSPSDEAEAEWERMQREKMMLQQMQMAQKEVRAILEAKEGKTHTTVEPRPNAYIPEDLGIPKPYGVLAPFKPQEPGSTMRHIRKPQPQEIVL